MITAIKFDCFGVLVGSGFADVYQAAGGDPVKDAAFIDAMLDKANAGQISSADFNFIIADKLGLSVAAFREIARQQEQVNRPLLDYIRTELKPHYKLAIVSNANVGSLQRRLGAEQLAIFDAIIVSAEVGYIKPELEIFELAARRLGDVPFAQAVFVDDSPLYVAAAAALGLHALRYTGLETLKQALNQVTEAGNGA